MISDNKCLFCGAELINEDHCHICHAFKITGYVSGKTHKRIKLASMCISLIMALSASIINFVTAMNTGVYIVIFSFSFVLFFLLNKYLFAKEVRKGKVVWKRAMIAW